MWKHLLLLLMLSLAELTMDQWVITDPVLILGSLGAAPVFDVPLM